jgi:hypothetical protein
MKKPVAPDALNGLPNVTNRKMYLAEMPRTALYIPFIPVPKLDIVYGRRSSDIAEYHGGEHDPPDLGPVEGIYVFVF